MNRWMRAENSALVNIPRRKERTIGQLGIPRMDREHAILAELIEHLDSICHIENAKACLGCILSVRDNCQADLSSLVTTLTRYMQGHFRYEERLMEGVVPRDTVADHKADHARIETRVLALVDDFGREGNSAAISRLLIVELRDWLKNHTETHDAILASYVATEEHS